MPATCSVVCARTGTHHRALRPNLGATGAVLPALAALGALIALSAPMAAQTPQRFESRHLFAGVKVRSVLLADFSGEGDPDLVFGTDSPSNSVFLRLGDGEGGFCLPKLVLYLGTGADQLRAADLDLDGDLELLAPALGVKVWPNLGLGVLGAPATYGASVNACPVGDLDEDGLPDLATGSSLGDGVRIYLGTGGGLFGPGSLQWTGLKAGDLELVDLNLDGHLDLLAADYGHGVRILQGDGTGVFGSALPFDVPLGGNTLEVEAGDLDGDGWPDMVATHSSSSSTVLIPNLGFGVPGTPVDLPAPSSRFSVKLADLEGDGDLDIVAGGAASPDITVYENVNGPWPAGVAYPAAANLIDLALADIDGDGALDVAGAAWQGHVVTVLRGDGSGGFVVPDTLAAAAAPRGVATGDFDGDGFVDAVVLDESADVLRVHAGSGGGFLPGVAQPAGAAPADVVVLDLDGDGQLDIATTATGSDKLALFFGDGTGGFPTSGTATAGVAPWGLAAGDLDGDGDPDLLVASAGGGGASALENLGAGVFGAPLSAAAGTVCRGLAVGDLDGDGDLDAAVADEAPSGITTLEGSGTSTTLVTWVATAVSGQVRDVALADVDGDGVLDALAPRFFDDLLSLLPGQGDGSFGPALSYAVPRSPLAVETSDVDGDGLVDVLVLTELGGDVAVLLNNGAGGLGPVDAYAAGAFPRDLALADVDNDGRLDLLATLSTGELAVLHGEGPTAGTIADLGNGMAGTFGVPLLAAAGTLQGGAPTSLDLTGALGNTTAWQILSFCFVYLPFKSGVVVPDPTGPALLTPLVTDGLGQILLGTTWPHGVPSGTDLYAQYWVVDAAGPQGWAASNGVRLSTP